MKFPAPRAWLPLLLIAASGSDALAFGPSRPARKSLAEVLPLVMPELRAAAAPGVVVLDHDIDVFPYRPLSPADAGTYFPPDSTWATRSINAGTQGTYLNPNENLGPDAAKNLLGPAVYTAIDPAVSRSYASPGFFRNEPLQPNAPWLLFRIRLARGTKILDLNRTTQLSESLQETLRYSLGCGSAYRSLQASIFGPRTVESETPWNCRPLAKRLVQELGITAVAYSWSSSLSRLGATICPTPSYSALILTGLVPAGSVVAYTSVLPPQGDSESETRTLLQAVYGRTIGTSYPPLWPSLAAQPVSDEDVRIYARDHLYSCGD